MKSVIYACDVGSTLSHNFAWYRNLPDSTDEWGDRTDIVKLVDALRSDLTNGSVALGFEAPLFIPVPEEAKKLGKARKGEENRAWSTQIAGHTALLGLLQATWILRELSDLAEEVLLTFDPEDWRAILAGRSKDRVLFLWEALVSGKACSAGLLLPDAVTAAIAFQAWLDGRGPGRDKVKASESQFSLVGAAALWSGWTSDTSILKKPVTVITASEEDKHEARKHFPDSDE